MILSRKKSLNPKPAPPDPVMVMSMPQVCAAAGEASRKVERVLLQTLARVSQVKVAERMGVSESTVSRIDKATLASFIASCGLKVVPVEMQCFDPDYIHSLKVLAGVGLQAPEPRTLEWDDK